ncbi:hypothetical protein V3W47_06000 [Deinococcus sp. YIM 134068]|uniref:hypothetical protein n=1 Tax=Deinococcus lichenicola TaxID=3118910 RepID=UPI002F930A3A
MLTPPGGTRTMGVLASLEETCMKRMLLLSALTLAACAPTVQQAPTSSTSTAQRSYRSTCPIVFASLNAVAVRTRPADLLGGGWPALTLRERAQNRAVFVSQRGGAQVVVTGTCTETTEGVTLTLTSTGQRESALAALHQALLSGIDAPR